MVFDDSSSTVVSEAGNEESPLFWNEFDLDDFFTKFLYVLIPLLLWMTDN